MLIHDKILHEWLFPLLGKCCLYDEPNTRNIYILMHEFFFSSIFEIYPETGSYRLYLLIGTVLDHFFQRFLPILKLKFLPNVVPGPRYAAED